MPVIHISRTDILITRAAYHLNRLVNFDLHDERGYFAEERWSHRDALEAIFVDAEGLGHSRDEFYQCIIFDAEIYESDQESRLD